MLLKVLGWLWIVSGILFLWKPEWLRNNLRKRSTKTIRRIIAGLTFALGILFINATWGMPGLLPKIIMALGLIGLLKAFFFLKAKSATKVIDWYVQQPTEIFRAFAVGQVILGAVILSI